MTKVNLEICDLSAEMRGSSRFHTIVEADVIPLFKIGSRIVGSGSMPSFEIVGEPLTEIRMDGAGLKSIHVVVNARRR